MLFSLIDCNNFYVSCERVFNPKLENKPVVILSNNDGCIISRSNEAKLLKIPMGAPYFKWQSFCRKNKVYVFSSNYELYGDMSQRVMTLLKDYYPYIEIYSIDEAFLQFIHDITFNELVDLRETIKQSTGIPISIGIGPTKTLSKIANYIAKNMTDTGVHIYSEKDLSILEKLAVDKVWGIGHRLANKLNQMGIDTVAKLRAIDPHRIRLYFNVSLEKTVRELNGFPALQLETVQPRQQIVSSRSFGKKVTELSDLEEAVSHFAAVAAKKLRDQHSVANAIYVFLQTNIFKKDQPQYANGVVYPFSAPQSDTRYLIHIAKKCVRHLYKKNYEYHKAGIMLLNLLPEEVKQYDLLMDIINKKSDTTMQLLDDVNRNFGRNTLFIAAEGIAKKWKLKSEKRTRRYTTRIKELPIAYCH